MLNKMLLLRVELAEAFRVAGQVDLFGGPERGHGLLVELPRSGFSIGSVVSRRGPVNMIPEFGKCLNMVDFQVRSQSPNRRRHPRDNFGVGVVAGSALAGRSRRWRAGPR